MGRGRMVKKATAKRTLAALALIGLLAACSPSAPNGGPNAAANEAVPPAQSATTLPDKPGTCDLVSCAPGTSVYVLSDAHNPVYGCDTEAIAEYVTMVLGLVQAQATLAGSLPNIDPQTGEPEYEGETKQMLANARTKAGVDTFDQALARCSKLRKGMGLMVMNYQAGRMTQWVGDAAHNRSCWVEANALERRR
jgi:hypothetical protein